MGPRTRHQWGQGQAWEGPAGYLPCNMPCACPAMLSPRPLACQCSDWGKCRDPTRQRPLPADRTYISGRQTQAYSGDPSIHEDCSKDCLQGKTASTADAPGYPHTCINSRALLDILSSTCYLTFLDCFLDTVAPDTTLNSTQFAVTHQQCDPPVCPVCCIVVVGPV